MQEIIVRHIRTLEEFASLKEEWGKLIEAREQKTAFLTWEWLHAWWKNYGEKKELWLLTTWHEGKLVGAAPLMLGVEKRLGLSFRHLQSLGKPNTDEWDVLALSNPESVVQAIFSYINDNKNQWDSIELCELNSESSMVPLIKSQFGALSLHILHSTNDHYYISTAEAWDDYWKSLSKNTRDSIEKRYKQGKKKLNLEFEYIRGSDVTWQHFDTIFAINEKGRYPEKYGSEQERSFLKDLVAGMHEKQWLEIFFLHMDNQPVAFDYGFNIDGKFEDWRTGYDMNYSTQAAGKILLYLMLKQQFEGTQHHFDFLRGAYEYKTQWNPKGREFSTIIAIKRFHLPARLILDILPRIWRWIKLNILRRRPN